MDDSRFIVEKEEEEEASLTLKATRRRRCQVGSRFTHLNNLEFQFQLMKHLCKAWKRKMTHHTVSCTTAPKWRLMMNYPSVKSFHV